MPRKKKVPEQTVSTAPPPVNAFDWRSQRANPDWRITSIKTEAGIKGAKVTSPKIFHLFQKVEVKNG